MAIAHDLEHLVDGPDFEQQLRADMVKKFGKESVRLVFEQNELPTDPTSRQLALSRIADALCMLADPTQSTSAAPERLEASSAETRINEVARKYIDLMFGQGASDDLDATTKDASVILDTMLTVSDGVGETDNPEGLKQALELMLQGDRVYAIAAQQGVNRIGLHRRLNDYCARVLRVQRQKDLSPDDAYKLLYANVQSARLQRQHEPELERVAETAEVSEAAESLLSYQLTGPFTEKAGAYVDGLTYEGFSEKFQLQKGDAFAIVEAITALNRPWDVRSDPTTRQNMLFRVMAGFGDTEIARMRGATRENVKSHLQKTRLRTLASANEKGVDITGEIARYVESFRADPQLAYDAQHANVAVYGLAELPQVKQKQPPKPRAQKQKPVAPPKPKPTPRPRPQSSKVAPLEPVDDSLFDEYLRRGKVDIAPDDTDCPSYSAVWDEDTLSRLYDVFYDPDTEENYAEVIRQRADGTDKTRRLDPSAIRALGLLKRRELRSKTDFNGDEVVRKAFDMLTDTSAGRLNTLGDIYRALQGDEPDITDRQAAYATKQAVNCVLKASE
jgi:hypothetical protein